MKKLKLFATTMFFLMEIINFGLALQIKNEQIPTQTTSTENVKSQYLTPTQQTQDVDNFLEIYEDIDGALLSKVRQSELIIIGTIIRVKQFKNYQMWKGKVEIEKVLKGEIKSKRITIISEGEIPKETHKYIFYVDNKYSQYLRKQRILVDEVFRVFENRVEKRTLAVITESRGRYFELTNENFYKIEIIMKHIEFLNVLNTNRYFKQKLFEKLLNDLKSEDYWKKRKASLILLSVPGVPDLDTLMKIVNDKNEDSDIRGSIMKKLGEEKVISVVNELKKVLKDGKSSYKYDVVETLAKIGNEEAIESVLEDFRREPYLGFPYYLITSTQAIPVLIKALDDKDVNVRIVAIYSLCNINSSVMVNLLIQKLNSLQKQMIQDIEIETSILLPLYRVSDTVAREKLKKRLFDILKTKTHRVESIIIDFFIDVQEKDIVFFLNQKAKTYQGYKERYLERWTENYEKIKFLLGD